MSTVATKRGPYARTRRKKEDIARAVLEIVEQVGHEGVTIAMVSERTNTPEATVLYHFPSRDHLLVGALELWDQDGVAETHTQEDNPVLSLDDFRALLRNQPRNGGRITRLIYVLKGQTATPDHAAVSFIAARNERLVKIFTKLVERRQHDGFAHPDLDPRLVAIQLIATWDGLTGLWLLDPTYDIADPLIDAYRRLAGENVVDIRNALGAPGFGL